MPRKYVLTKADKELRRHAARVAVDAIQRLEAEGLISTAAYRHSATGITLDRALEQNPLWLQDVSSVSFPEWLEDQDTVFSTKEHTIGFWADQRSQDEVLDYLRQYAVEVITYNPEAAS